MRVIAVSKTRKQRSFACYSKVHLQPQHSPLGYAYENVAFELYTVFVTSSWIKLCPRVRQTAACCQFWLSRHLLQSGTGSNKHTWHPPVWDIYGLALTAFAAWQFNICHTRGVSDRNTSV